MSLLGLWHPAGADASTLEVCAAPNGRDSPLDVAVIAPGTPAGRARLQATIAEAAARLSAEGVAWVLVGRRDRDGAERALRRAGLVVVDRVLMVPAWPATEHLVPLVPDALRDAGVRQLGLSPRRARVLARLCRGRAGRLLASRAARGCGLVAARPAAAEPLRWLGAIDGTALATATMSSSARHDGRVAVALRFPRAASAPDLAVKLALDSAGALRVGAERDALQRLGAAAAGAGAGVPVVRHAQSATMLVTSALTGSPASALLLRAPGRLGVVLHAVADWLLAWNRATAGTTHATAALLERRLLGPAARIAVAVASTSRYAASMRALAARLQGAPLVTVAAHDDLTMSNLLVGPDGLGVVDWEAARADDLPLLDLWYALADGVARAHGVAHSSAVELLRGGATALAQGLAGLPAAHAAALGLSGDQALLGFHACWLGHADDELSRGTPGPFVAVVEAIAAKAHA